MIFALFNQQEIYFHIFLKLPLKKLLSYNNTAKLSCLIPCNLLTSNAFIGVWTFFCIYRLCQCYICSKWLSARPAAAVHMAVMLQEKKPLAGLRHSCMSSELRNYPAKWQHITLPADYNNTVNYFWSSIKLEVKDDCVFGTSFWNTSVLSLETIYCSSKRAGCCFCLRTWVVQRMSYLKCKKLKELCSILPLTIETPSTNLAPSQRRGWKIGS